MDSVAIIIFAVIIVTAVIGLIVGLVKGFTKVKSWSNEYVLSAVLAIVLGGVISENMETMQAGALTLGVTVALLLIFMLLSAWVRNGLKRHKEKRQKLSYYRQYNDIVENDESMADALEEGDKRTYRSLSRRKFKRSGGVWSFYDKVLGGITVALKAVVVTGIIAAFVLAFADLLPMEWASKAFGGVLATDAWVFCKQYLADFIIVGLLFLCIKCGFSSGISNALWAIFVLCMVVGAGYVSYSLAFHNEAFVSAAQSFDQKVVSGWFAEVGSLGAVTTLSIAEAIIMVGLFVLLLVFIILLSVFVPRLIRSARNSNVFYVVDGVFGAIAASVIVLGILMLLGSVLAPVSDLEILSGFTAFFENSRIATYFYTDNVLYAAGMINLPVREWLS